MASRTWPKPSANAPVERRLRSRPPRRTAIITSNRRWKERRPLFVGDLMASAAMDRLTHDSHAVVIEGRVDRNPPGATRAG